MNKPFDRAFLAGLLPTVGLGLALMTAGAPKAQAQVIGANGANGADGVYPGDLGLTGGEGQSVSGSATVIGGNGGAGGNAGPPSYYLDGDGGDGARRRIGDCDGRERHCLWRQRRAGRGAGCAVSGPHLWVRRRRRTRRGRDGYRDGQFGNGRHCRFGLCVGRRRRRRV